MDNKRVETMSDAEWVVYRKENEPVELCAMSNAELWKEFINASIPDGWDGWESDHGEKRRNTSKAEVERRLEAWLRGESDGRSQ